MINKLCAQMYCSEPIEKIENYEKAVEDTKQIWDCHHIWETMLGYSREELIEMNEYYGIPAQNLIFLTRTEHKRIHKIGTKHTEETRRKMSEVKKGKCFGENNPFFGKHHTEEYCKKKE